MIQKSVEASIIHYALELAALLKKSGDIQCQKYGITSQQWLILLHLANDPNVPFFMHRNLNQPVLASELAHFFKVSRANITNLLNVLLEKKLIRQVEDESDRRRKFLILSEEGARLVAQIEPQRTVSNMNVFSAITPAEKVVLFELLQRCVKHLSTSPLSTSWNASGINQGIESGAYNL